MNINNGFALGEGTSHIYKYTHTHTQSGGVSQSLSGNVCILPGYRIKIVFLLSIAGGRRIPKPFESE